MALVSRWRFNEGTGTTAADSVGSNTGTLDANVTWISSTPEFGTGVHLASTAASAVTFGHDASLNFTTNLSMAAWIALDGVQYPYNAANGNVQVVNKLAAAGGFNFIISRTAGALVFNNNNADTSTSSSQTTLGILDTNWHHIAVTLTGGNPPTFYVDGSVWSRASSSNHTLVSAAATDMTCRFAVNSAWGASVDDIQVYSSALTAAEVAALYSPRKWSNRNDRRR